MKLVHKDLEKGGSGTVVLVPDEPEDMWHAYNLIMEGDSVKASTVRKVNKRYENDTEIIRSTKVKEGQKRPILVMNLNQIMSNMKN